VTQDMSTCNVHNSFADDEEIFDYVGGGADDQAAQVGTIANYERSGVSEVRQTDPQHRSNSDVTDNIRLMTRTCLKAFTTAQTLQTSVHRCTMSNTTT